MSLRRVLSRFTAPFRSGTLDPAHHWGSTYRGTFEPSGSQVSGIVADCGRNRRFPPASILVTRDGDPIGSASEFTPSGDGWRFTVTVASPVTADDIVRERIKVIAVDLRGGHSDLVIEGAIQLSYVRELLAPPSETELVIDFAAGGNSREYVGAGWSNPEPTHTWSDGKQATIVLKFRVPGVGYRVEFLAWPFVVANALTQQTVQVCVDDTLVTTFVVNFGQKLLQFDISGELTGGGQAVLRLDFFDAARPCDITGEKETRMVAIAMRRLTLKRRLDAATTA